MYGTYTFSFISLAVYVSTLDGVWGVPNPRSTEPAIVGIGSGAAFTRSSVRSESLESFSTKFLSCSRGDVESWLGGMWDVGMIRARADVSMRARMSLLQLGRH